MAGSTFGTHFRITTWGESHGTGIGVVVDGCPAGLPLCESDIQYFLDRRKPGQSRYTTPRKEGDKVKILSVSLKEKPRELPSVLQCSTKISVLATMETSPPVIVQGTLILLLMQNMVSGITEALAGIPPYASSYALGTSRPHITRLSGAPLSDSPAFPGAFLPQCLILLSEIPRV